MGYMSRTVKDTRNGSGRILPGPAIATLRLKNENPQKQSLTVPLGAEHILQ